MKSQLISECISSLRRNPDEGYQIVPSRNQIVFSKVSYTGRGSKLA
jgi:hypothetical protein